MKAGGCGSEDCGISFGEVIVSSYNGSQGIVIDHCCPRNCLELFFKIDKPEHAQRTFLFRKLTSIRGESWPQYTFKQKNLSFGFLTSDVLECERFVNHYQIHSVGSWFFSWKVVDSSRQMIVDRTFHIIQLLTLFEAWKNSKTRKLSSVRFEKLPLSGNSWAFLDQLKTNSPENPVFFIEELYFDCLVNKHFADVVLWLLRACKHTLRRLKIGFDEETHVKFVALSERFPRLRHLDDTFNCVNFHPDTITKMFPVLEYYNEEKLLPRSITVKPNKPIRFIAAGVHFRICVFTALNRLRSRDAHRVYFYLKKSLGPDNARHIAQKFFQMRLDEFGMAYQCCEEYRLMLKRGNRNLLLLPEENYHADLYAQMLQEYQEDVQKHGKTMESLEKARIQMCGKKRKISPVKRTAVIDNKIFEHRLKCTLAQRNMAFLVEQLKNESFV